MSSFTDKLGGSFTKDRITLTRDREFDGPSVFDLMQKHEVRIMELQDQMVRDALIKLGWTPPGVPAGIDQACTEVVLAAAGVKAWMHANNCTELNGLSLIRRSK